MIRIFAIAGAVACAVAGANADPAPARETILFIRHGEKQPHGIGQLSCKGLNRALALPAVLQARYGKIDAVFAPDPSHQKPDGPLSYDYVRPLATVEPAAIRFGLPVHAAIGYEETGKLRAGLLLPEFHNAIVLVAWEHHALNDLVPEFLASLGGQRDWVKPWPSPDFDSIWRVTIERGAGAPKVAFAHERQNLDGQSDVCPNAASPPLESGAPNMLEHKQNKFVQ